jgi:hypothetical protein
MVAPEWTRASIGIPIDTVVRVHGVTPGAVQLATTAVEARQKQHTQALMLCAWTVAFRC